MSSEKYREKVSSGWTKTSIYSLFLLTIVYAFNTADRFLLGLLIPQIQSELMLSDTMVGLLSGFVFALFYAVAGIPIAWMADRWNRRNIIAIGFAFWSIMTAVSGLVQNTTQLFLARFALGAGEASSVPPSNSMIGDIFPPYQRPLALAIFSSAGSIGILVAFPIIGAVALEYGWRVGFIVAGLPGLVVALIFFLTMKEPERGLNDNIQGKDAPVDLKVTLKFLASSKGYIFALIAVIFINMNLSTTQIWVPAYLTRTHDLNTGEVGQLVGVLRGSAGILGAIFAGWLTMKLGRFNPKWRYRIPAIAMLCMVPSEILFLFSSSDWGWQAGLALETFFGMAQIGPLFAMLISIVPPRMRAVTISVTLAISHMLGQSTGPLLAGYLSDQLMPTMGDEGLRFALLTAVFAAFFAGLFCYRAGQVINKENT